MSFKLVTTMAIGLACAFVSATELTFDPLNGVLDTSRYGNRIIAADDAAGVVSMAGGPTPNIRVEMRSLDPNTFAPIGDLFPWDWGYGDLHNVIIHWLDGMGEIRLIADPGTSVHLSRLQLGAFPGSDQVGEKLEIVDFLGTPIVDLENYLVPGIGHREITVNASSPMFRIRFSRNWNIGLDNILFSGYSHSAESHLVGEIVLGDWVGYVDGQMITVELLVPGTETVVHTYGGPLSADGTFAIPIWSSIPTEGTYDIRFSKSHWLRKRVAGITLGGNASHKLKVEMTNGDIDEDNEVGIGDYALLSFAYGSVNSDPNWVENADLDGDSEVAIGDYAVLSARYGEVGD